jgi:hypothetical protein
MISSRGMMLTLITVTTDQLLAAREYIPLKDRTHPAVNIIENLLHLSNVLNNNDLNE